MRVVDSFPHDVREIEHLWIPLPDGTRLAARAWLPAGPGATAAPAVVEYIPYGKRHGTRDRDEPMHRWLAGHGYACLRIDLRGSGESDGVLLDEYLPQELADGVAALAWIAAQPWCSGAVGLIGKSWGGFNALQLAALRPPALRAVVTVCSTDDRYADDAHYMGGCPIIDNLYWGATFFQLCAQPPDPELVGPSWRAAWRARLEACEPPLGRWLRHPLRDGYWRHGSVREDYAAIDVPVFAVGGWADAYSDAVPRLLGGLRVPRRGLIGPWGHQYPHQGVPGPAIGFLQEARGFFDRWLRGIDDGAPDEPLYRAWMQESVPAGSDVRERPGRWIAEARWPSPRIGSLGFALAPGRLLHKGPAGAGAVLDVRSPLSVGRGGGGFFSSGLRDQRGDDEGSLCFDSEPLAERLELFGAPELRLVLASDRPTAFVAARLCDVAPDGGSIRVSYGLLNLTHRDDHTRCEPLVPGRRLEVALPLHHAAHAFPAGHRLRLALSSSYWPLVWPSPEPVALRVWTDGGRLDLPVRPPDPADGELRPFEPPEAAPEPASRWISRGRSERSVDEDPATGDVTTHASSGRDAEGRIGLSRFDAVGIDGGDAVRTMTRMHPSDPLRARVAMEQETELQRGSWRVLIETRIDLACTRTHFELRAALRAREDGGPSFERDFAESIPRVGN